MTHDDSDLFPEKSFEQILESLPLGLALSTLTLPTDLEESGPIYANQLYRQIYGNWSRAEYTDLSTFLTRVFGSGSALENARRRIMEDVAAGDLVQKDWENLRITQPDGTQKIVSVRTVPLPDLNLIISSVQDITERSIAEQSLRESERRYQLMTESTPVGIFRLEEDGLVAHVNRSWREITGLRESQALGQDWSLTVHPDDREGVLDQWQQARKGMRSLRVETRFRRPAGKTVWVFLQIDPVTDGGGRLEGFIGSVVDISQRKRTEEEVRQLAYYDTLTRLPNRTFFMEQLERAMATSRRTGTKLALLFCDLDNFKDVNDSLGHDKGDLLLQQIGNRLNACTRRGDTLCRLGGDEFVLLLPSLGRAREAALVARKIMQSLLPVFDLDGHQVYSRGSIGIAVYPNDGSDVQTLLKHADTAMYAAKAAGRNRFRFFSEEMNRRAQNRLQLESGLRQALTEGQLSLAWQPQYDLQQGRLVGVEALLRWKHPELGLVPPKAFIPIAEESGLIHEIGAWVLKTACSQARNWINKGLPPLRVAVNLSTNQFKEPGIIQLVQSILAETGLAPELLELEITESVLMDDADSALETLRALRLDGINLAIDDFGTGYSSLMYVKKLPVSRIKIARDFVKDIATDAHDAAIARTVINMASSLNMRAIAEGVETEEQVAVLREMGCPEVQGFHFCPPVDAEELERRIQAAATG
jgi:diguanylate cyclase (GGDEF)-like protein/PAS domain S-box-containing protein